MRNVLAALIFLVLVCGAGWHYYGSTEPEQARSGWKHYYNNEFDFEFWYPGEWKLSESNNVNSFISHMVEAYPVTADGKPSLNFAPLKVLVTTQEYMDRVLVAIKDQDKTSPVVIDGTSVLKHEYLDMTLYRNVIVPRNDHVLFITNENSERLQEYNEILATFKLLN